MSRYVVVTDKLRGVYWGKTDAKDGDAFVVLSPARICFQWEARNGIGDLSTVGPLLGSKIGPIQPRLCINDVANVADCTKEAVEAWTNAGWG